MAAICDLRSGSWADLDYILFLSGFDGITISVSASGRWQLWAKRQCEYLSGEGRCDIHDQAFRPEVCKQLSYYGCWYQRALGDADGREVVFLEWPEVVRAVSLFVLDGDEKVVGRPSPAEISALPALDGNAEDVAEAYGDSVGAVPTISLHPLASRP